MKKRGKVAFDLLTYLIIGLVFLVLATILILILTGKGNDIIAKIKSLFGGG